MLYAKLVCCCLPPINTTHHKIEEVMQTQRRHTVRMKGQSGFCYPAPSSKLWDDAIGYFKKFFVHFLIITAVVVSEKLKWSFAFHQSQIGHISNENHKKKIKLSTNSNENR
jgi:hypothetical protein